jgi:general stress protein 26
MSDNLKQTVLDLLNQQQMVMVATSMNNQPRVRPMTLICHTGKFFFATGSWDAKAVQVASNPLAEICILLQGENCTGYVRASGQLDLIADQAVRKEIYDTADFLHYYWNEPTDESYILYQMQWDKVEYMQPGENKSTTIDWQTA